MSTKFKGDFAVAQAIAKFYLLGYEVLLPIGDRMLYDLAFDDGKGLHKTQIKFAGKNPKGHYLANLRITGGNRSFNYARKYEDNDFDYLYVYTADNRHYLIKWSEIKYRNAITIDDPKYQKYLI